MRFRLEFWTSTTCWEKIHWGAHSTARVESSMAVADRSGNVPSVDRLLPVTFGISRCYRRLAHRRLAELHALDLDAMDRDPLIFRTLEVNSVKL